MEIVPGNHWGELLHALRRDRGTALFTGGIDAGKSTLVRWLVEQLVEEGETVALVDADVGQSALCLPGAVGMKVFRNSEDVAAYGCDRLSFLGSPNPARVALQLIETAGRFVREARQETDLLLIDTTGLVTGSLGMGLKLGKIRSTGADRIVAIQREGECAPILEKLRDVAVHRLTPSPRIRARSPEARATRRAERLRLYFDRECSEFIIGAGKMEVSLFGRDVSLTNLRVEEGTVIGLNRGWTTIALGVVTEADGNGLTFRAPLRSLKGINRVVLSDIVIFSSSE